MTAPDQTHLSIPDFALVVLIGSTGSGKSSFAARHFLPTEVISSDRCRALVSDDETDQDVSADAFDLVREIAGRRLKHRKLTVIDATNVRAADRKAWIALARTWHALPVAIVIDPGIDVCIERNRGRANRPFGVEVVRRMTSEIRKGLGGLQREGFRQVWKLTDAAQIEATTVARQPLWTDRRADEGPFDIIGDVHGCAQELELLLERLGYRVAWLEDRGDRRATVTPPAGRKAVFVGDLVDRGPNSPDCLRIAMSMVEAGDAYCVQGNHERKLGRWLEGRKVTAAHGLQQTIDQLEGQDRGLRETLPAFLDALRSHYWLDGGRLAVAHAGLKEEMVGRGSGAVREFALYGETTGEIDAFGLPVRADWAAGYRGKTAIVYGHTPVLQAEWGEQHHLHRYRLRLRRQADRPALARAGVGRSPCGPDLVRARPPARRRREDRVRPGGRRRHARHRRRNRAALGRHRAEGPDRRGGGERRRRPGGDEPVRDLAPVACLSAADHVAGGDQRRSRVAGAAGGGVRTLPRPRGGGGRVRGEAHGLARRDRPLPR